jgi:hypothetical protein
VARLSAFRRLTKNFRLCFLFQRRQGRFAFFRSLTAFTWTQAMLFLKCSLRHLTAKRNCACAQGGGGAAPMRRQSNFTEWDYSQLADAYLDRQPYAKEALEIIFTIAGLGEHSLVCGIGAGVGHLTIPLAEKGCAVIAVEPDNAMRTNGIQQRLEAQ